MSRELTVIIPNWNGARPLERLLSSLRCQTVSPATIYVVDNGSSDDSLEVARRFEAYWLPMAANLGFAKAVNAGIAAARTEWIAILNNDVTLAPDCLELLLNAISDGNSAFAVPRLLSSKRMTTLDGSFDFLARSACAWRAGHGAPDGPAFRVAREVLFPPFTAVLFRRDIFVELGTLDETFDSYLEDVDFGLRCALAGLSGRYVPEAVACHEGSASLGAWSPRMVRLISRNQILLAAKHFSLRYVWPLFVGQTLWGLLALTRGRFTPWLQGKLDGLRLWSTVRAQSRPAPHELLDPILRACEAEIRSLQRVAGADTYWRSYFLLAP